tara:strand:- start:1060 stop:1617 length:558 start_codon:yes stop_codon:yes gene_type:complete
MTKTLNELLNYLRNPILEKDSNQSFLYRFKILTSLLWISITISFLISLVNGMLTSIGVLDENNHITETLFKDSSGLKLLLFAAVMAPIIEEIIFRAPLVLFKQAKIFKIAFYGIGIIFAYVHILNFEINTNVIIFSPLLVAPQFFVGLIFGFIRVRFGLLWSICLHGLYNGLLISLFLIVSNGNT